MSRYPEIDLKQVKLTSIARRRSRVELQALGRAVEPAASFARWWDSLPAFLAAEELKAVAQAVAEARRAGKPVIVMMGAHVIKVGLSPVLIDLMHNGLITALAMNGAGIIHDTELALYGVTSEDVAANLSDGSFGMVRETGEFINGTVREGVKTGLGLGEALGKELVQKQAPNLNVSLLGQAYNLSIPVTVHVALGADIIHQQPSADGAAIGEASLRDFRILAQHITGLGGGGVVLNIGSAVILPEVFLKALTVARNLGHSVQDFTAANFDMIQHYRPRVNVVSRPTLSGGKGYTITGHHEIMIPLLAMGVKLLASPPPA
jgi:hypothetical protein